jgi:hypothetical protein
MLRIFRKTTLYAAVCASLGIFACSADAQELTDCPPEAALGAGAGVGLGNQGLLHHNRLNCRPQTWGSPELFYNYYVPGTCGGNPAQLYLAPRPVPPYVGHTYVTYQPFMPHELLYQHHRRYYRYYNGGRGLTRTCIHWYRPPVRSGLVAAYNHFRIAR